MPTNTQTYKAVYMQKRTYKYLSVTVLFKHVFIFIVALPTAVVAVVATAVALPPPISCSQNGLVLLCPAFVATAF